MVASYPAVTGRAVIKEIVALDQYRVAFLALCPFVVLSTADLAGRPDVSPRGGEPGSLGVLDSRTLVLPDRPGVPRPVG